MLLGGAPCASGTDSTPRFATTLGHISIPRQSVASVGPFAAAPAVSSHSSGTVPPSNAMMQGFMPPLAQLVSGSSLVGDGSSVVKAGYTTPTVVTRTLATTMADPGALRSPHQFHAASKMSELTEGEGVLSAYLPAATLRDWLAEQPDRIGPPEIARKKKKKQLAARLKVSKGPDLPENRMLVEPKLSEDVELLKEDEDEQVGLHSIGIAVAPQRSPMWRVASPLVAESPLLRMPSSPLLDSKQPPIMGAVTPAVGGTCAPGSVGTPIATMQRSRSAEYVNKHPLQTTQGAIATASGAPQQPRLIILGQGKSVAQKAQARQTLVPQGAPLRQASAQRVALPCQPPTRQTSKPCTSPGREFRKSLPAAPTRQISTPCTSPAREFRKTLPAAAPQQSITARSRRLSEADASFPSQSSWSTPQLVAGPCATPLQPSRCFSPSQSAANSCRGTPLHPQRLIAPTSPDISSPSQNSREVSSRVVSPLQNSRFSAQAIQSTFQQMEPSEPLMQENPSCEIRLQTNGGASSSGYPTPSMYKHRQAVREHASQQNCVPSTLGDVLLSTAQDFTSPPSLPSTPMVTSRLSRGGLSCAEVIDAVAVAAPQRAVEQQQMTSSRLTLGLSPRPVHAQVTFAAKQDVRSPKTQPRVDKPFVRVLEPRVSGNVARKPTLGKWAS